MLYHDLYFRYDGNSSVQFPEVFVLKVVVIFLHIPEAAHAAEESTGVHRNPLIFAHLPLSDKILCRQTMFGHPVLQGTSRDTE